MNKKQLLTYAALILSGAIGGYLLKSPQVEIREKEKIKEIQVTTEAQKELLTQFEALKTELQRVRESQTSEKYHREELETKLADGTYTRKVTVDRNIDSHTKETETKVEVKVVEVEKKVETIRTEYVDHVVEKEKIVTPKQAQWHSSVMGGVVPTLVPLAAKEVFVGVGIERRIVGPVFFGVWGGATTTGTGLGGVKIGLEF